MTTRCDEALAAARRRLAGCPGTAALDAELLLTHVAGCSRATLAAHPERVLDAGERRRYDALVERRAAGEPVAYLTGHRGFWTLELEVGPAVLVPRPETELLVELVLAAIADTPSPTVADLGTGSGAIALAIASERPDATVDAVESDPAALALAGRNATGLGLGNVRFHAGEWFGPLAGRRYHAVVSNPPYLAADDPHLAALAHEPRAALVAGPGGLEALAAICGAAAGYLLPGGLLAVEHGAAQGAAVRRLCDVAGLRDTATHADLAGLERATTARAG